MAYTPLLFSEQSSCLQSTMYGKLPRDQTSISATADGPLDVLCEMKYCQLLYSCAKITFQKTCM